MSQSKFQIIALAEFKWKLSSKPCHGIANETCRNAKLFERIQAYLDLLGIGICF